MDKNVKEIEAALLTGLPASATDWHRIEARRLAELRALTQRLRGRALAGRKADLDRLCRVERMGDKLARALGVDAPPDKRAVLPWQSIARKSPGKGNCSENSDV